MNWTRYLDIILYRAYAEVKSEAQVHYMGYIWWFLEPLINTILFYVIVIMVMQQSSVGTLSFILVGTIIWQWFHGSVVSSSNTILDAGSMLKFIYLPKIILPSISILASTWRFFFLFVLLLIACPFMGHIPTIHYLVLPLLLLLQMILILGFSLPIAAVIPYLPDTRFAVDVILRSLMFVSAIFFSIDQIPAKFHVWVYLNPMAVLIESYRDVLLYARWPNFERLAVVGLLGSISLAISALIYKRIDLSVVKSIHR